MKNTQKSPFDFLGLSTMCLWEREKAIYLMGVAQQIDYKFSNEYGSIGVNQNSGYTYLWCEAYNFCLFMPISCNLSLDDVYLSVMNEDGEEFEACLTDFNCDIQLIENWASDIINSVNQ